MFSQSNSSIDKFLQIFSEVGVHVAFLVPTTTGYEKSIMDAIAPVRELLLKSGLHDYGSQKQGPDNKVIAPAFFVETDKLIETNASLYRPVTKNGDPRIWFSNLKRYCKPCDLLALVVKDKKIYVFNLSNKRVSDSLLSKGHAYSILKEASTDDGDIARDLLKKIKAIHDMGFLPSITRGDPGVGDTLEHALGIDRNNRKSPDYKGIELKASRISRGGTAKPTTRQTLFSKVPDEGMTYHQIVTTFGKWQAPRGSGIVRQQIYDTCRCHHVNSYGLLLEVDSASDRLKLLHQGDDGGNEYVCAWVIKNLQDALLKKHHETFWVKAASEHRDGIEFFRYNTVIHTKNPNASLVAPLLETGMITVDLLSHINYQGRYRDHGLLFKMMPNDLPLLMGEPTVYDLGKPLPP